MRRFVIGAVAAVVAAIGLGGGQRAQAQTKDEQEIRAVLDRFTAAFSAKDVDAIMKSYAPGDELFVFDLIPPRDYKGWDAYRKDWQAFVAGMPGPIKVNISEVGIKADGTIGYSHSIQHGTWTNPDGSPGEITVRVTDVFRKIDGKWLIVQEHVSVPVDMTTGKPDMLSKE